MKYLCLFLLLVNCVSVDKHCQSLTKEREPKDDVVYLLVDITILKDDVFRIYYIPEGDKTYEDKRYLETEILGSKKKQVVQFEFPKGVYLQNIRLDISEVKQKQKFEMHNITFVFEEKCFAISDQFDYYFKENKFIKKEEYNPFAYETKELSGRYDPHFVSRNLIDVMDYLLYID